MEPCLFCQIIQGTVESNIIYADSKLIAFKDLHPKAPVHVLVVPREHIASLNHLHQEHQALMGDFMLTLAKIAKQLGLTGFRTQFNTGKTGGQEIFHLHAHLLGSP